LHCGFLILLAQLADRISHQMSGGLQLE